MFSVIHESNTLLTNIENELYLELDQDEESFGLRTNLMCAKKCLLSYLLFSSSRTHSDKSFVKCFQLPSLRINSITFLYQQKRPPLLSTKSLFSHAKLNENNVYLCLMIVLLSLASAEHKS